MPTIFDVTSASDSRPYCVDVVDALRCPIHFGLAPGRRPQAQPGRYLFESVSLHPQHRRDGSAPASQTGGDTGLTAVCRKECGCATGPSTPARRNTPAQMRFTVLTSM